MTKDGPNYAINPEHIIVSPNVRHLRCSQCQSLLCVAEEDAYATDMHCLFNGCQGSYSIPEELALDYYKNVYQRNWAPRIYAHEHTGMLDREVREQVEDDFKNRPKPDSINTLVATSTLEMGIDIGSLNTVVNTDTPPLVSNFLQRVGRAGRDSGTALIVDFARNRPHDLFYFEEPTKMMRGEVLTPGCFLSAKDILRRHFLAYCIDCWTGEDPARNSIPPQIRFMGIGADFLTKPDFFLNRLIKYINDHLDALKDSFRSQYDEEVRKNAIEPLFETLGPDGSFEQQMRLVFQRLQQKLDDIRDKVHDIHDYIREQKIAQSNPLFAELDSQRRSLCNQRSKILKQQVLEFMTDEGLLPNYAFPEKGVTFEGSIRYQPQGAKNEGKKYYSENIELVRPASSALKELAPGNYYYTDKYRMRVDGVDTYDWNLQNSSLIKKRFCSKCDYIEDETSGHALVCPKCGDASFGSDSNVHEFVRMTTAKSDMLRKDALAGDPVSAFGGVLVANAPIDKATAEEINKIFFEVIIAPDYDFDALEILGQKKNRIILVRKDQKLPVKLVRSALNGVLVQDKDTKIETPDDLKLVTSRKPSDDEIEDMLFANKIVKNSKSNSIVFARGKQLLASGVGQTSRVDALKQAVEKAHGFGFTLEGAAMASDAFFPFPDCVELADKAGVKNVIHPGGSVRDQESVDYCEQHDMTMVMTGFRHFKH